MRCIVCGAPARPNFDLAVCGSACESVVEAGDDQTNDMEADNAFPEDDTWLDDARNEADAEAFFSQWDDDPNPYDGTYSEM